MKLGSVIKEIRTSKGIKQNFVAKKAGISPVFLSQIESDIKTPSMQTLKAIAEVLDLPLALLVLKGMDDSDIKPELRDSYEKAKKILEDLITNS